MRAPASLAVASARAWASFGLLAASWLASAAVLWRNGLGIEEPVVLLVLLGLAFPGLALLSCRGLPPLPPGRPAARERALLVLLVLFVGAALAFKGELLGLLVPADADGRVRDVANVGLKLALFVAVPLSLYALVAGLSPRALGLGWPPGAPGTAKRSWISFGVVGAALVALQLGIGRGARPLVDGSLSDRHWILGVALCWLWMAIEAGVVEEVFFRAVLQSRLAAVTGSQAAGLFLGALLFGVSHAPGLWLRGQGAIEGLGGAPSLAVSLAYSVATMAVAGLVFGVLWLRTRNALLVVALHGLLDALANAGRFMDRWGL